MTSYHDRHTDFKLDLACKTKAEAEKGERKNGGLTLDEITKKNKEEFARTARSYVIFLFKGTQGLSRFKSDIVKRLGSIMLVDPLENASYCIKQLFSSFRCGVSCKQRTNSSTLKNTCHSLMSFGNHNQGYNSPNF